MLEYDKRINKKTAEERKEAIEKFEKIKFDNK